MRQVDIDGTRAIYVPPPTRGGEATGTVPGIVVVHELFGLNSDIRRITDRLSARGYAAVAPDLYSDGLRPLCIARTVRDAFADDGEATAPRLDAVRRWLARQPEVDGDRIGIIGFCMGAGLAVVAAARHPFAAASINYGQVPDGDDALDDICPVVGSYGGRDTRLLPSAELLREQLARRGVDHDVEVYANAGHSFLNTAAPAAFSRLGVGYEPDAAAHAWQRIDAFFDDHLRR